MPPPDKPADYWLTVIPCYGRDPKTAAEAARLWLDGKDFQIADVSSRWNGAYTSVRDHPPAATIKVRYDRLAEFVLVRGGAILEDADDE